MNELVKIQINENNEQVVSGRELHKFLEITERYSSWFERMCTYGFVENIDFVGCKVFNTLARQELDDHLMKITMAKEISMLQRNEKGGIIRRYFVDCENKWNSPEMILIRADQIKTKMIDNLKLEIDSIKIELEYKKEIIEGITNDIDVYQKQQIINRVVKHKGSNFSERWNELYTVFKETYSVDLKARRKGYDLKQVKAKDKCKSVLEYAVKFGHLDSLYNIALKLYETDMNEIIENIRKGLN